LKRRLVMILNGKTPRALSWSGLLATLGLCAALLPLSPSWADEKPDATSPEIVGERVERAPDPERTEGDVLKFDYDFKLPDRTVIHRNVLIRVNEGALKPLQAQLDELSAKKELTKEEEVRRTAIEHAIEELKRALGDRGQDAESRPEKPKEREGKEGEDERREERAERQGRVESQIAPQLTPAEPFTDDPEYQARRERVAELERRLERYRQAVRSLDDPALRSATRELESAKKEMAAHREKLRGAVQEKNADLEKARAELREQSKELSKRRAELMEAEQRYQEARERLARMERPGGKGDVLEFRLPKSFDKSFDTWSRDFRPGFPFSKPGARPQPMIVPVPAPDPSPRAEGETGPRDVLRAARPFVLPDSSRRISELEKKLDRVLEELKGLKEEKSSKPE
jgi:hypothetical protein